MKRATGYQVACWKVLRVKRIAQVVGESLAHVFVSGCLAPSSFVIKRGRVGLSSIAPTKGRGGPYGMPRL